MLICVSNGAAFGLLSLTKPYLRNACTQHTFKKLIFDEDFAEKCFYSKLYYHLQEMVMHVLRDILSGFSGASALRVLCAGCVFLSLSITVSAQNSLERISKVERRDGKGVVIRYHI